MSNIDSTKTILDKPRLRVLHVLSNFGVGGAEVWLIELLKHFKRVEDQLPFHVDTHVFLTHGKRDVLDAEAESLGATLHYSTFSRQTLPRFVGDWRRVLRKHEYHAVHDHQENTAGLHFLMGEGLLPTVRIVNLHNPLTHHKSYCTGPLRRFTLQFGRTLIARYGTHIAGTSRQLIHEQGFFAERYNNLTREAVHCGFDTSRFLGHHNDDFPSICEEFGWSTASKIMLFVGRLDSHEDERMNQKNPVFALNVARICAQKNQDFRFLMAGGGETVRLRLEAKVKEWGLSDRIRLIGRRNDVARLMRGSHLFLLSSIAEGLGMVAVEAQAAGLPAIVSDVTPRECCVVPSMVQFISLSKPAESWADAACARLADKRPIVTAANSAVRNSGFSIENSSAKLLEYYSGKQLARCAA